MICIAEQFVYPVKARPHRYWLFVFELKDQAEIRQYCTRQRVFHSLSPPSMWSRNYIRTSLVGLRRGSRMSQLLNTILWLRIGGDCSRQLNMNSVYCSAYSVFVGYCDRTANGSLTGRADWRVNPEVRCVNEPFKT